ncbi:uncharacterized protein CBL_03278 [Carabus blaptoides fortunei]
MARKSYFDSETFITEVEKRPALYNKTLPEFRDKNTREKLWSEVSETVVPNWNQLDLKEKRIKCQDVQRKWRNIRDHFRRELNMQKKTRSKIGQRKRRKYLYFDQLLFLLPTLQKRVTSGNVSPPGSDDEDFQLEQVESTMEVSFRDETIKVSDTKRQKKQVNSEDVSKSTCKSEEIDEDKYFLMSLLPSFGKFDEQEKLTAKVEFLQVIQRITSAKIQAYPQ